jgi:hypothetical protein
VIKAIIELNKKIKIIKENIAAIIKINVIIEIQEKIMVENMNLIKEIVDEMIAKITDMEEEMKIILIDIKKDFDNNKY